MKKKLSKKALKQFNDFAGFLSFQPTWDFRKFVHCPHQKIAHFTGNQRGKTAHVAYSYVMRILGINPVPKKNVVYFECEEREKLKLRKISMEEFLSKHGSKDSATWIAKKIPADKKCPECGGRIVQHRRDSRIFRFCSETLPGQSADAGKQGQSAEVKNTQYPEFKKWLPPFLLKRDITYRNPAMTIIDPFNGPDIIVEFVSYSQTVQRSAGQKRLSVWIDEECSPDFYEEQLPRVLAEDGDIIFSLTPANMITWIYDEIFEKAAVYYRTECVCDYLSTDSDKIPQIEKTDSTHSIAVLQAATDDNPTLEPDVIENLFDDVDDDDVLALRRYGIFKQVSGRVFKDFDYTVHVIDGERYFPDGMFHDWTFARGIDYHEHNPLAIGFMALSPYNEAFIYQEWYPSPEKWVTVDIAQRIAQMSGDYKFTLDLIDPLATKTQTNTGTSVVEDLNRFFHDYKREGLCTGAYWQAWDTKSTRGRDEIRRRFKNAKKVGRPFNNVIIKDSLKTYLPTLWILNNCKLSAQFMKQWRKEEWADRKSLVTKDSKDTTQQKFSHFNMVWEAIFKDRRFRPKRMGLVHEYRETPKYYQGGR